LARRSQVVPRKEKGTTVKAVKRKRTIVRAQKRVSVQTQRKKSSSRKEKVEEPRASRSEWIYGQEEWRKRGSGPRHEKQITK